MFPGRNSLIDQGYRDILSFRELCRDYRKCAEALEAWRRSVDDAAPLRIREYADLLSRLGDEIESWLEAMESRSEPRGRGGSQ